jgi:hypothetical protein
VRGLSDFSGAANGLAAFVFVYLSGSLHGAVDFLNPDSRLFLPVPDCLPIDSKLESPGREKNSEA